MPRYCQAPWPQREQTIWNINESVNEKNDLNEWKGDENHFYELKKSYWSLIKILKCLNLQRVQDHGRGVIRSRNIMLKQRM